MKKSVSLVLGILVSATMVFASKTKEEKVAFEVDTKASKVYWNAKKVTGEHSGFVSLSGGKVWVENNSVVGANINMDMNTIVNTDLKDEEWNNKLVGHLKSEDFFSVEKFPVASFEITSVKSESKGDYMVKGNLTIKGITNEISFPAKVTMANENVNASGTAKIDRTKWDIRYGSGKFFEGLGDKMIYDEFEITFDLSAKSTDSGLTLK